jgi:hypothetical protein
LDVGITISSVPKFDQPVEDARPSTPAITSTR